MLRYIKMLLEKHILCEKIELSNETKVFVFLAADYGNVGDIAITCSQVEFLKNSYPDYEIVQIPLGKTYRYYNSLKSQITPNDIITIIGGGNMGDLYYGYELKRQFVIRHFNNNRIISFPQSICFSNTYLGNRRRERSVKIYSKHKDLIVAAREKESYELMKKNFKDNTIVLTPDIVLNYIFDLKPNRENVTVCLRNDKEQQLGNDDKGSLITLLEDNFSNFNQIDTHLGDEKIDKSNELILRNKLVEFAKSKVVITDRLHGMIFCAITGTPCIAFGNNNRKIENTYFNWLSHVEWISFQREFVLGDILKKLDEYTNKFQDNVPVRFEKEFLVLLGKGEE